MRLNEIDDLDACKRSPDIRPIIDNITDNLEDQFKNKLSAYIENIKFNNPYQYRVSKNNDAYKLILGLDCRATKNPISLNFFRKFTEIMLSKSYYEIKMEQKQLISMQFKTLYINKLLGPKIKSIIDLELAKHSYDTMKTEIQSYIKIEHMILDHVKKSLLSIPIEINIGVEIIPHENEN